MQVYKKNGLNKNVFKAIAVIMTLCYILGPAERPLRILIHRISHQLEFATLETDHHNEQHHHIHKGNHPAQNNLHHHNHHHQNQVTSVYDSKSQNLGHEHEVLDFLALIFEKNLNDNQDNSGTSTPNDFKINKHITSHKYIIQNPNLVYTKKSHFGEESLFLIQNYLNQIYKPPKV